MWILNHCTTWEALKAVFEEKLAMEAILQVSPKPGQIHVGKCFIKVRQEAGGQAACLPPPEHVCGSVHFFIAASYPCTSGHTDERREQTGCLTLSCLTYLDFEGEQIKHFRGGRLFEDQSIKLGVPAGSYLG